MEKAKKYIREELKSCFDKREIQSLVSIIIENITGFDSTQQLLKSDYVFSESQIKQLQYIITRLLTNEPIQYITGETEFYGLKMKVNDSVLIPRPETEELVEWILETNSIVAPKIIDIGTGSGCIAIVLAKNIPKSQIIAIDASKKVLDVAKENSALNNTNNIIFKRMDILTKIPDSNESDIIVSNPPYVKNSEKLQMSKNVLHYEPHDALFVDNDNPLIFYSRIAEIATKLLKKGGILFFEINENHGNDMIELLTKYSFTKVEIRKDINGKDRMIKATRI